eukprot:12949-Heterococcus_DN1.PRE.1
MFLVLSCCPSQLYRDCLRLANHVGGRSPKGEAMRKMIGLEFRKNATERDAKKIEDLKVNTATMALSTQAQRADSRTGGPALLYTICKQAAAVRGLSNYFLHESSGRDARLQKRMAEQQSAVQQELRDNTTLQ